MRSAFVITVALLMPAPVFATQTNMSLEAIKTAAVLYKVPFSVLKSICYVESKHNPKALNRYDGGSPSYGLCQIKVATARAHGFRGVASNLFNPYINARYAAIYLNYQYIRYRHNWIMAIAAYNKGHANQHITNVKYVNKVLSVLLRDLDDNKKSGKRY